MDAKLFTKMIMELLSDQGQVVLNDFGTFSTEIVPAHFSDKGFTLNPPYLKARFSMGGEPSDSLPQLYSSSNGIDIEQAKTVIDDFVAHIRNEIATSRVFVLPGFGILRAISQDNVFFIPEEGLEMFPGYDTLEPIYLKSISGNNCSSSSREHKNAGKSTKEYSKPKKSKNKKSKKKSSFSFWKFLLIMLIIAVVLAAALAIMGRYYPDLVDPILYSPEELKILRYKF